MLDNSDPSSLDGFALERFFNTTGQGAFRLVDLLAGLVLSALLTLAFVQTYKATHRGATYSVAFLQSLFILASCTTLIMLVIGSNIARAFSLVGALSIIRFRTAMKDPRDVGFVFAVLAVGMATGTGFYAGSLVFTLFLCLLLLILARLNVCGAKGTEAVLRVTFSKERGSAAVDAAEAFLMSAGASPTLVNRVIERSTGEQTVSWRLRTGAQQDQGELQQSIQKLEGVESVGIFIIDDFHVL
ncbi:MAG: DUF4956 domain-containing protein [Acidobacteria bacterium]|nr:DUF4956 domain-containing protein [Acidobacteriota bacterium]